ncbi:unnamed protein product [Nesidiocoris tenuis]|uniref:Uncharacterized protein n=1 Tax=Nesidiocoris tenuis TaxID=355587 RepID=A0A6H5H2A6_9HEMI|nr:unnamed protein product [Nesidiocoris tenuis]
MLALYLVHLEHRHSTRQRLKFIRAIRLTGKGRYSPRGIQHRIRRQLRSRRGEHIQVREGSRGWGRLIGGGGSCLMLRTSPVFNQHSYQSVREHNDARPFIVTARSEGPRTDIFILSASSLSSKLQPRPDLKGTATGCGVNENGLKIDGTVHFPPDQLRHSRPMSGTCDQH